MVQFCLHGFNCPCIIAIKNHITFLGQTIYHMNQKNFTIYVTFKPKFIILNLKPFQMWNLLIWTLTIVEFKKAVCGAYLLTNLSQAILQFPSRNSKLFAFCTSPNATFITDESVLMIKSRSLQAISYNLPNFIIFSLRSFSPSRAFSYSSCIGILSIPYVDPLLTNSFYILYMYHMKGTSWTSFSN